MKLFGFSLGKEKNERLAPAFSAESHNDGAIEIVQDGTNHVHYDPYVGHVIDLSEEEENIISDKDLILGYRGLSTQLYIDEAIEEIANEAIVMDSENIVTLDLNGIDTTDAIKNKIHEEFNTILKLLNFKFDGYDIFRKFYVDGRLVLHKILGNNAQDGIKKIIIVDPISIKLIREITKVKGATTGQNAKNNLIDINKTKEYYLFSEDNFESTDNGGLPIEKDSITYINSGVFSPDGKQVLSHLNKSTRIFNNLRMLEDSLIVLRVSRAPERRIFYVDVGSLPTGKAEQYLKDVMNKFKSKVVYDAKTGKISSKGNLQSMMEDYWLPRREGGKGTEVSTLPGDSSIGELTDVEYFKTKLFKSLIVPISRIQQDGGSSYVLGRASEISREEVRFNKFVNRLRVKFSECFHDLLKTQLILKNIITEEDWQEWDLDINYIFADDNHFAEIKETEMLQGRIELYETMQNAGLIGKYYSNDTIRRNILKQSDEEIIEEKKKIDEEFKSKEFDTGEEE